MIKLTSCNADGSNERPVWVAVAHIVAVELENGRTQVWLTGGMRLFVTESVDDVVKAMTE
jgi:uncharacterized protein YlzI (FlbEa/FlbD family)